MKIVADGREYPFPEDLEMGELRLLKRHFDLARPAVDLDLNNIDHVAGLLFISMRRMNNRLPDEAVIDRVDAIHKVEFVPEDGDKAEDEAGPTEAAPEPPSSDAETPGE